MPAIMRRLPVSFLALFFTTSVLADDSPSNVLKDNGLVKFNASVYVHKSEVEMRNCLKDVPKAIQKLKMAQKEERTIEEAIDKIKQTIRTKRERHTALDKQRNRVRNLDVDKHNDLVGEMNAIIAESDTLREEIEEKEKSLQEAATKTSQAREAFSKLIFEAREHANSAASAFDKLNNDPAVNAALKELSTKDEKEYKYELSGLYKNGVKELEKHEKIVLKGDIELKGDNGTFEVDVLINGKVTKEFVFDTGASFVSIPRAWLSEIGIKLTGKEPVIKTQIADGTLVENA